MMLHAPDSHESERYVPQSPILVIIQSNRDCDEHPQSDHSSHRMNQLTHLIG